jgi:hypothetical protein
MTRAFLLPARVADRAVLFACLAVLAAGCSARRGGLPDWVVNPPTSRAYLYAVGVRSGAPTIEEARRGAVEQAVGELVRGFGVTSRTAYEEVRSDLATRVHEELRSESAKVEIKEAVIQDWHLRRAASGYDAFVLLRYPRAQAEREKARLQSREAAALHAAAAALRRGDTARARGDAGGAIAAYLDAAGLRVESAAGAALRAQTADRLSVVAGQLRIEGVLGGDQLARPSAPLARPLVVRVTFSDQPAARLPMRFVVIEGEAELAASQVNTDAGGYAMVTVSRVLSGFGNLAIRATIDTNRLAPPRDGPPPADTEGAVRAVAERAFDYFLPIDRAPRATRIAVLVDERDGEQRERHSVVAIVLAGKLREAGFRVVADHELGKTNLQLLGQAFDTGTFLSLNPALGQAVDVVLGGWSETRRGSENRGWAVSVLADASLKAVDIASGETIAAHSVFGRAGFGERPDRARMQALTVVAEELADAMTVQLAAHEAVFDHASPASGDE